MARQIDRIQIERALTEVGAPSSDFDLNPSLGLKPQVALKPAGVLVPLIARSSGLHLILTKRSTQIRHHPGQIAFPGGRVDADDADHIAAALREADEEIGLPPCSVDILGELPSHITVSNYTMLPVVGFVREDFRVRMEPAEVSEVFEVPLRHVLNFENYSVRGRVWQGVERHFFTVPHGPHYIWGATARVLRSFAQRMATYET